MLLRVGVLLQPWGLRGGIFVSPVTDFPGIRFAPGSTLICSRHLTTEESDYRPLTVRGVRQPHGADSGSPSNKWVVFFQGIYNRTEAADLTGFTLLAKPLASVTKGVGDADSTLAEPDEWYDFQLAGMEVVLKSGEKLGHITGVEHLPMQDLLVVATKAGNVLLPFVKSIVVNISYDRVTVDPPRGMLT